MGSTPRDRARAWTRQFLILFTRVSDIYIHTTIWYLVGCSSCFPRKRGGSCSLDLESNGGRHKV